MRFQTLLIVLTFTFSPLALANGSLTGGIGGGSRIQEFTAPQTGTTLDQILKPNELIQVPSETRDLLEKFKFQRSSFDWNQWNSEQVAAMLANGATADLGDWDSSGKAVQQMNFGTNDRGLNLEMSNANLIEAMKNALATGPGLGGSNTGETSTLELEQTQFNWEEFVAATYDEPQILDVSHGQNTIGMVRNNWGAGRLYQPPVDAKGADIIMVYDVYDNVANKPAGLPGVFAVGNLSVAEMMASGLNTWDHQFAADTPVSAALMGNNYEAALPGTVACKVTEVSNEWVRAVMMATDANGETFVSPVQFTHDQVDQLPANLVNALDESYQTGDAACVH
ncbi:MAG: hypothetical protein AAF202_10810 [Pseudomonadota bacterium]